jgi:hypothetical protein
MNAGHVNSGFGGQRRNMDCSPRRRLIGALLLLATSSWHLLSTLKKELARSNFAGFFATKKRNLMVARNLMVNDGSNVYRTFTES